MDSHTTTPENTAQRERSRLFRKFIFGSTSEWLEWVELAVVSSLAVLIWRYQVGLEYDSASHYFFWSMFGPLLIALRYGFAKGLISILFVLTAISVWDGIEFLEASVSLPVSVGTTILTMLVGEFRDTWHDSIQKQLLNEKYIERRLESFTQSYHLLKVSHDLLEQRLAGAPTSLRTAVQTLRQVSEKDASISSGLANKTLDVVNDIISLFQAGFYKVQEGKIEEMPIAFYGEESPIVYDDPMVQDALKTKLTVAVRDHSNQTSTAAEREAEENLHYKLVIPVADITGEVRAIIAAKHIRFIQLTEPNIALIHLIASYIANFISNEVLTPILRKDQGHLFKRYLESQKKHFQNYRVDSSLVILRDLTELQVIDFEHATDFRRGADTYWLTEDPDGRQILVVILPMATLVEAERFLERMASLLASRSAFESNQLEYFGPLLINTHSERLEELLESFGVFSDDSVDINSFMR